MSRQRPPDLLYQGIERRAHAPAIRLLDQQHLQRGRPRADFGEAECAGRAGEGVGDADQRIVANEGSSLMRDGLQLGELIGAADEEALAQRGEGVDCDGRRSSWTGSGFAI
jgi:hypothetical protein